MHTKFGRNRLINKGDIIVCILHKNSIRQRTVFTAKRKIQFSPQPINVD